MQLTKWWKFFLGCMLLSFMASNAVFAATADKISKHQFQMEMRNLWTQHVTYSRFVITSDIEGSPDVKFNQDRLLANKDDIGNALICFYGEGESMRVSHLLKQFVLIQKKYLESVIVNDPESIAMWEVKWDENADAIAKALANLNPHYDAGEIKGILCEHIRMTKKEICEYLAKQYAESIITFDDMSSEIQDFADYLTKGLVKQFPSRFTI